MTDTEKIPMFPLSIFPLPGEMVPLHIFEPRYKELLRDAEAKDFCFGIFFNHVTNTEKIGSLVKLESVIKKYPQGESDIIVKCLDLFTMHKLFRTFRDKLYPGGEVNFWKVNLSDPASSKLQDAFKEFLLYFKIRNSTNPASFFTIANELSLDFDERMRFVQSTDHQKENFLLSHLRYQSQLLQQAEKAKDVFHLN